MDQKKRGRPCFIITEELCQRVRELAAQGLSERQVASVLGVHQSTLIRKKKQHSSFLNAIEQGKAEGVAQVSNALFRKALDGNVTAQMFFLKTRDPENWADRKETRESELVSSLPRKKAEHSDLEVARRVAFLLHKGIMQQSS